MRFFGPAVLALVLAASTATALPVSRCINLGNTLDAPTEGAWGPPLTRSEVAWIAAAGFDAVRLPVRFNRRWDGAIDPALLARADEVIGWAREEGLTIILDLHHFEALMTDPVGQGPVFLAIWEELARHYAGAPDDLIFELLNEATGMLTNPRLEVLFAEAIATIRQHHPDRWIIAGGENWNSASAMFTLGLPEDARVALTFHHYEPYPFTHQLAPWTGESLPARGWGTEEERADLARRFRRAAEVGRPVLLGEFGVYGETELQHRLAWSEAVRREAEANGFGWCIWALDAGFPVRDRATGDWIDGFEAALMAP